MQDTASHSAPGHDVAGRRHTMSISLVATELQAAGVPRSHRHLIRLCKNGSFDAEKYPGASGDEWFVAPDSLPKVIGDLRAIEEARARRGAPQPDTSDRDAFARVLNSNPDTASHGAPQRAVSDVKDGQQQGETEPNVARRGALELDVYEHPYVKKLEERVEKLEAKYEAQVHRTEEIQLKSQQQIIELQRMTAIGQSQTLADFMLKAKEWILGQAEVDKREADIPASS